MNNPSPPIKSGSQELDIRNIMLYLQSLQVNSSSAGGVGPQGPAGPQGIQGIQGPAGPGITDAMTTDTSQDVTGQKTFGVNIVLKSGQKLIYNG